MTEYTIRIDEAQVRRYRMMAERARTREGDAWTDAGFNPGARVADVGCGPAAILVDLAHRVLPGGEAIGVERDADSAAIAEQVLAATGAANARIVRAPADATGLEAGSLDAIMLRHVLVHNDEVSIRSILAHLAALLRPGGCLYVVDSDLEAIRVVPPDADVSEETNRYREMLRRRGCDVNIGPRLGHLLAEAGLVDVRRDAWWEIVENPPAGVEPPAVAARPAMIAAGLASDEEGQRWDAARARLRAGGDVVLFAPAFRAVGRRPA